MFLYNDVMMAYTWGRNLLPDSKHSRKNESCVAENIVIHSTWKYINKTKNMRKVRMQICHFSEFSSYEFAGWRWGESFQAFLIMTLGGSECCTVCTAQGSRSGQCGEEKSLCPIGIETNTPRSSSPYVSLYSTNDRCLWTPPEVCTTRQKVLMRYSI
jgi:hypothetical protein